MSDYVSLILKVLIAIVIGSLILTAINAFFPGFMTSIFNQLESLFDGTVTNVTGGN